LLVDKDRDIDEGLELVGKALVSASDDYNSLYNKGWGLYKLIKYQEALEILQKNCDLGRMNTFCDQTVFIHLKSSKRLLPGKRIIKHTNAVVVTDVNAGLANK
jgi:tetratricopeptide (TPR) repeat protein